MTKHTRRRLSVWLCLCLTVFLFCQGMAKAAGLFPTPPQSVMPADMPGCHEMAAPSASSALVGDCHLDCQHLDKLTASAYLAATADQPPPVLMVVLPFLRGEGGSPLAFAALPDHDPPGDPPIPIRLQRFLK